MMPMPMSGKGSLPPLQKKITTDSSKKEFSSSGTICPCTKVNMRELNRISLDDQAAAANGNIAIDMSQYFSQS